MSGIGNRLYISLETLWLTQISISLCLLPVDLYILVYQNKLNYLIDIGIRALSDFGGR